MGNPFDQSGSENQPQFEDKAPEEFLEELVGEGKKYATPAEAIRALAHANHHISKLEGENATFRTQLEKAATVDDILSKLKQQPESNDIDTGEDDTSKQTPSQDVDVDALVEQALQKHTQKQTASQNKQQVIDSLQATFGEKAGQVWDEAEGNLGIDLEALASTSPAAALKLLGATGESQSGASGDSFASTKRPPAGEKRAPEGSKRLVEQMLANNEITRQQAYQLKLKYSADPDKYNA